MFLIERNFAEQLEVTADAAGGLKRTNEEVGVHWLYSFLSADKKKNTYCLYEALSAGASNDWLNEIHPNHGGYKNIAQPISKKIKELVNT